MLEGVSPLPPGKPENSSELMELDTQKTGQFLSSQVLSTSSTVELPLKESSDVKSENDPGIQKRAIKRAPYFSDDDFSDDDCSDSENNLPTDLKRKMFKANTSWEDDNEDAIDDTESSDENSLSGDLEIKMFESDISSKGTADEISDIASEEDDKSLALESVECKIDSFFNSRKLHSLNPKEKEQVQYLIKELDETIESYTTGPLSLLTHDENPHFYFKRVYSYSWLLITRSDEHRLELLHMFKDLLVLWNKSDLQAVQQRASLLSTTSLIRMEPKSAKQAFDRAICQFLRKDHTLDSLFRGDSEAIRATLSQRTTRYMLMKLQENLKDEVVSRQDHVPSGENSCYYELWIDKTKVCITVDNFESYRQMIQQSKSITTALLSGENTEDTLLAIRLLESLENEVVSRQDHVPSGANDCYYELCVGKTKVVCITTNNFESCRQLIQQLKSITTMLLSGENTEDALLAIKSLPSYMHEVHITEN